MDKAEKLNEIETYQRLADRADHEAIREETRVLAESAIIGRMLSRYRALVAEGSIKESEVFAGEISEARARQDLAIKEATYHRTKAADARLYALHTARLLAED